jgi:hypothetical protein
MTFWGYINFFITATANATAGAQGFASFTGLVDTPDPLVRAILPDFRDTRVTRRFDDI